MSQVLETFYTVIRSAEEAKDTTEAAETRTLIESCVPVVAKVLRGECTAIIPPLEEEGECLGYLKYFWTRCLAPHKDSTRICKWVLDIFRTTKDKGMKALWHIKPGHRKQRPVLPDANTIVKIRGVYYRSLYQPMVTIPDDANWAVVLMFAAVSFDVLGMMQQTVDAVSSSSSSSNFPPSLPSNPKQTTTIVLFENKRVAVFTKIMFSRLLMNCRRFFFGLEEVSYSELSAYSAVRKADSTFIYLVPRDFLFRHMEIKHRRKDPTSVRGAPVKAKEPRKVRGDKLANRLDQSMVAMHSAEAYLEPGAKPTKFTEQIITKIAELVLEGSALLANRYHLPAAIPIARDGIEEMAPYLSQGNVQHAFPNLMLLAAMSTSVAMRDITPFLSSLKNHKPVPGEERKDVLMEMDEEKEGRSSESEEEGSGEETEDEHEEEEEEQEEQKEEQPVLLEPLLKKRKEM